MKKKNNEETREASIVIKAKYSQRKGIEEMEQMTVQGSKQILVSMCLGLIKQLCAEAKANYTELLSNEIKREVYEQALKRTEEMRKKENEENGN